MNFISSLFLVLIISSSLWAQYPLVDSFQLEGSDWGVANNNEYNGHTIVFYGADKNFAFHTLGGETRLLNFTSDEIFFLDLTSVAETRGLFTFHDQESKSSFLYSLESDELLDLSSNLDSDNPFLVRDNFIAEVIDGRVTVYDHDLNKLREYTEEEINTLLNDVAKQDTFPIEDNIISHKSLILLANTITVQVKTDGKRNKKRYLANLDLSWDEDLNQLSFVINSDVAGLKIGKYICSSPKKYSAFRLNGAVQYTPIKSEVLVNGNQDFPFLLKIKEMNNESSISIYDQTERSELNDKCENLGFSSLGETWGNSNYTSMGGISLFEPSALRFQLPKKYKNKTVTTTLQKRDFGKRRWKTLYSKKIQLDKNSNLNNFGFAPSGTFTIDYRLIIKIQGTKKQYLINIANLYREPEPLLDNNF